MVDAAWLSKVRAKNQAAFGMAGMGASDLDIVSAHRGERELRTQSIHRGRFERHDPYKPPIEAGTVESFAQALGPAGVPAPQAQQRTSPILTWAIVGMIGLIGVALIRRSSS